MTPFLLRIQNRALQAETGQTWKQWCEEQKGARPCFPNSDDCRKYTLIARYPGAYKAGDSIKEAYRLVGPYDTFEDYCKDVEGLAYTVAREKIRAYLVHKAIEENLGIGIPMPSIESQVSRLFAHEGSIAKFKTEKRSSANPEPSFASC